MWIARFTDAQRDALKLLIEAQGELGPSLAGAAEALDLARWDDLPDAELPWEAVSTLATLQGIGEADRGRRQSQQDDGSSEDRASRARPTDLGAAVGTHPGGRDPGERPCAVWPQRE